MKENSKGSREIDEIQGNKEATEEAYGDVRRRESDAVDAEVRDFQRSPSKFERLMFSEHFKITWRVALITLSSIGFFGGGGYLLDKILGNSHIFLIIGTLVSFPLSQIAIYKSMKNLTKKL